MRQRPRVRYRVNKFKRAHRPNMAAAALLRNVALPSQLKSEEIAAMSGAFAVVEEEAEMDDRKPTDDIFNDEENVKDTLEFIGFQLRKK